MKVVYLDTLMIERVKSFSYRKQYKFKEYFALIIKQFRKDITPAEVSY
jgi:hypothetical protein